MFDSVLAWQFGAIALATAMVAAYAICKVLGIKPANGRNTAIDGMRGYLAFGVLLSHALIWYYYARDPVWRLPPESIYRDMGGVCVRLFFMITGYLFVGKLLQARQKPVNWLALYISRIVRLTPLYLVAMTALFVMVGVLSGWQLREPLFSLLAKAGNWLMFSLLESQDLNGVNPTSVLIAIVTWTLAYEWLFYLSLPTLALILRVNVSPFLVIATGALLVLVAINKNGVVFPTSFVVGAFAAVLGRFHSVVRLLRHPVFGFAILGIAWLVLFGQISGRVQLALVSAAFCAVACGNTALGLLSNRAAVLMGDISYGIYLLHGLVLSGTFLFVFGLERTATFSPLQHWLVVMGAGVVVVAISAFTYRFLEAPCMRQVGAIDRWIRLNTVRPRWKAA